ncbi:hypothetical protein EGM51_12355 [Verrucomicrobia bacterium S94]|nr:hypothetical protein EGM51_12355 [Verrucomicrobia bacterium S94]
MNSQWIEKMTKKTNISSKELSACAKAASTEAIRKAKANDVSYTVQEGRSIVQHRSDGTKRVVGTLPKAYVKPAEKRYRVS